MTAEERAALVERVAHAFFDAIESYEFPFPHDDPMHRIKHQLSAAIALIRAEVLEEAAKECAYHWTPKECAAAIRALKEK
jgi:hypothetical protein